jgi:hypothetical protein
MRKILTASFISMVSLFLVSVPTMAATVVVGNGSSSYNYVSLHSSTHVTATQTNVATLVNKIKTGSWSFGSGNTANNNTGGSTTVVGGNTDTMLGVTNLGNSNTSTTPQTCCPCNIANGDVTIAGNGDSSLNSVHVSSHCSTTLDQTNVATVTNDLHVGSGTGGNSASYNTGGDVTVLDGNSTVGVTVNNVVNSNSSM